MTLEGKFSMTLDRRDDSRRKHVIGQANPAEASASGAKSVYQASLCGGA